MKILLIIFLITRSQQYFFQEFIQNETYVGESRSQSSEKNSIRSMISNKVIAIIIACLSVILIAT
jgi:hypothetical protein